MLVLNALGRSVSGFIEALPHHLPTAIAESRKVPQVS
jgi:hypothetical protein